MVGAVLLAATAGCSGTEDPPAPSVTTGATPSGGAATPTGSSSASPGTADGPALVGKDFGDKSIGSLTPLKLRFDILKLARRGELLVLEAQVTNLETAPERDPWRLRNVMSENRPDMTDSHTFSGVALIDVQAKKRYLVAADSAKNCLCTGKGLALEIKAGQVMPLYATYAAPPASTTAVDIDVPMVGHFSDVPIS